MKEAGDLLHGMLDAHTPPTFQAVNAHTNNMMVSWCFKDRKIEEAMDVFMRSGKGHKSKPSYMAMGGYNNLINNVGGKILGWNGMENSRLSITFDVDPVEFDWAELKRGLYHWTKVLRLVQWYSGHITKTDKELNGQLKLMDVVIDVQDARIPLSSSHPQMDLWLGNRKRIVVLNREDVISRADRDAWASYYARQATKVVFSNGQIGMGALKLIRLAKELTVGVNVKRKSRGMLPRPVRAGIVGYPNVGKSSLINMLLKRRMCHVAPRPGVTREHKWVHFGSDLELLDSSGIIPMRIDGQSATVKLAKCDDIGERSYDIFEVATILVQILSGFPEVGNKALATGVADFHQDVYVRALLYDP